MTETIKPQDPMIPTGEASETVLPPKRVFDLSNIDELKHFITEDLSPGDLIAGLNTWANVSQAVDILVYKIVTAADPNPNTKHALQNKLNIEKVFRTRDEKMGYIGNSNNFEITILPTDLSFSGKLKERQRDPNLTRTFRLKRHIISDAHLSNQAISDACTISLTDEGITPELDVYKEEVGKIHQYKGSISIRGIETKALDEISASRTSTTSFGKSLSKGRKSSGPRNPL